METSMLPITRLVVARRIARLIPAPLVGALVIVCGQSETLALAQASPPPQPQNPPPAAAPQQQNPPPAAAPQQTPPAAPQTPPPQASPSATSGLNDPEVQKQLQGKTPEEAQAWGAQMSAKGMKRLPYDELVAWNDIRIKLAAASPAVCAGLWKGGLNGGEMQKALASLGKEETDRWIALSTHAIVLEANNASYPPSQPDDMPQLTKIILSELTEADQGRFKTLANKGANITDEEACWLMTTMLQKANNNSADQAAKERGLRALAALGSPK